MTDEPLPEEIFIDFDYVETKDNRFSLKNKEHRCLYTRAKSAKDEKAQPVDVEQEHIRKFDLGDIVCKIKGSSWKGKVVGFYSTDLTPIGYCVESDSEIGSVQIYPEAALKLVEKIIDLPGFPDVYYLVTCDNFYSRDQNKGLGTQFYQSHIGTIREILEKKK